MRYLAIDYGTKTTGLAICDPSETIVSPLAVFSNGKDLAGKIAEIIKNETVSAIVFGLPLNMDGTAGNQVKIVQDFANKLKEKIGTVPIYFQDERLSTFAAEEKLKAADLTRKKKRQRLDAVAAAEILQAFLDSKSPPQGK